MSKDLIRQEEISSVLLSRHFSGVDALTQFLKESDVKYILKEDSIAKEAPKDDGILWNPEGSMFYLVLLPRSSEKIYRFRVYPTDGDDLHIESDFAFKNPYQ